MNGEEVKMIDVRCPATLTTKKGYKIRCDHLCCVAAPGSVIQMKCRFCKTFFEAYIPEDAKGAIDVAYKNMSDL